MRRVMCKMWWANDLREWVQNWWEARWGRSKLARCEFAPVVKELSMCVDGDSAGDEQVSQLWDTWRQKIRITHSTLPGLPYRMYLPRCLTGTRDEEREMKRAGWRPARGWYEGQKDAR